MGMNPTDSGVYVFLFAQKLFESKTRFSAAEIARSMKSIAGFAPEEFRIPLSGNAVYSSLSKLADLGFVAKCGNTERAKSSGRPASVLYETVDLHKARINVEERLNLYKQHILEALERFQDVEEAVGLKNPGRGESDAAA